MSVNAYLPHLLVLPEDEANTSLANGFFNDVNVKMRAVQVMPCEGGWKKVIEKFKGYHLNQLRKFSDRRILLLVDFDGDPVDRLTYIKNEIPNDIQDRVFVLGVYSEPEDLRSGTGKKLEAIGAALAKECADDARNLWSHEMLKHNEPELIRMFGDVKPFLFHTKSKGAASQ